MGEEHVSFNLRQGGVTVAGAWGPRESAEREIRHYAAVYAQDGPVKVYERNKRRRDLEPSDGR